MTNPKSRADSPLRVGIALDSLVAPAWIAKVVRDLRAADFVQLALFLVQKHRPGRSFWSHPLARNGAWDLFTLYEWLDHLLFKTTPDAFEPVDLAVASADVEIAHVVPVTTS